MVNNNIPLSFAVRKDCTQEWGDYIDWLNNAYHSGYSGNADAYYGLDKRGKSNYYADLDSFQQEQ